MNLLIFYLITALLLGTSIVATIRRRPVIVSISAFAVILYWNSIPIFGHHMETYEDSYYYLAITREILLTDSLSTSGLFGLNISARMPYFIYHINSTVIFEVLGLSSPYNLLLLTQSAFALLTFISCFYVFYQYWSLSISLLASLIYMSTYIVVEMQTYDQAQASLVLFFFAFGTLIMVSRTVRGSEPLEVLSFIFISTLIFSHYATPLIVMTIFGISLTLLVADRTLRLRSSVVRTLTGSQKAMDGLYSSQIFWLTGIGILGLLLVMTYVHSAPILIMAERTPKIIDFIYQGDFEALYFQDTSQQVRTTSKNGPTSLLNQVSKLTFVSFFIISAIVSIKSFILGRDELQLVFFGVAAGIVSIPVLVLDYAAAVTLNILFFSAAGLVAFFTDQLLRKNKYRLNNINSLVFTGLLILLLTANIVVAGPASFIDPNSDVMRDGYYKVTPIGTEFKESGLWLREYVPETRICTSGRLRGAVTFYGQHKFPCWLSRVSTSLLSGRYILYDQARLFEPPIEMNRVYDNGRATLSIP